MAGHRSRNVDDVRRAQAAFHRCRQVQGVDREQLVQALTQRRRRAGPLTLQPFGVLLQLRPARLAAQTERSPHRRLGLGLLLLRQMADNVTQLVVAAPLHPCVAEHLLHGFPQGLGSVQDEQPPLLRIEPSGDQILQQAFDDLGILRGPFAKA